MGAVMSSHSHNAPTSAGPLIVIVIAGLAIWFASIALGKLCILAFRACRAKFAN